MLIRVETADGERFLEWSTVVDAPVTLGMTEDELRHWHRAEYGRYEDDATIDARIERCRASGTSSFIPSSVEAVVRYNRAGPDETCLTLEEIVADYCPLEAPDE
jgi:hypothetical protein